MEEVPLAGGIANAGSVVRVGDHVLRPSNPHSESVHTFLRSLRRHGFTGASLPLGTDADGRERLEFIAGDVAVPPFAPWARSDDALASIITLLARFHEASAAFDPSGLSWSAELADPLGGSMLCHNDICPENVVFRHGVAVALLDFDFCAPGRPVFDLAQCARMCVPIDDDVSAARVGFAGENRPERLRLVSDCYGLDAAGRHELLGIVDQSMAGGGLFVQRRVEAGDPNFTAMWEATGGAARYERRRQWWVRQRASFAAALA
jgi:hypothetical protein